MEAGIVLFATASAVEGSRCTTQAYVGAVQEGTYGLLATEGAGVISGILSKEVVMQKGAAQDEWRMCSDALTRAGAGSLEGSGGLRDYRL
tara:strand:- start:354 stop:623 length:270 start_codon:yes stop_codon:yes gene_type:complete